MVLGVDVREMGSHKGGRGVEKLVSVLLSSENVCCSL